MMTVNGISTCQAGQENYEYYIPRGFRKKKRVCHYDYRTPTGELFSTIRPTLEECRRLRDEWLAKN